MSRRYWVAWLASLSGWLLVFHQSIASMVTVWSQSKTYEHSFLIVPIAIWTAWQLRKTFTAHLIKPTWQPVVLLMGPCLLWIVGHIAGVALFEHVAAIVSLQLLLWAFLGHQLAKTFHFPILYLIFCIPFGDELIPYLQSFTADISVFAVRLSGIPVYRDGMYLTIPNGQFEVAEACSGIRFLISSIALGALFSHMFFEKIWKQVAFILFSAIFPIIANGVRAYGIILVGHLSDMTIATGADHLVYGWAFFAVVILIIFYVASKFSDRVYESQPVITQGKSLPYSKSTTYTSIGTLGTFLLTYLWVSSITQSEVEVDAPALFDRQFADVDRSNWGISFPESSKQIHTRLSEPEVELYAARFGLNQKNAELISYSNKLFDNNLWTLKNRFRANLTAENREPINAAGLEVVNPTGDVKQILYWYCINDYCSTNRLKLKLQKAYQLMTDRGGYAQVSALSSEKLSRSELEKLAQEWISASR
ncbi:exosortase A [Vibrio hannami]|uniref:exosortase A n=1 Tax=Vibrio hannami TaxID=2717094 RepID=UPI00240EC114|nr:exosortase A [Vibrio hannami]MDG3088273.1 exosortase A [Vibrio hannami]